MGTIYADLNSDFPDKVSTMTRVQDVSAAMKPYVDEYYVYYNRGDFDRANEVITAHPELLNMIVNAKIFNDLRDEIIAAQRVFKDDVESYIFNVVKNKGDWNASIKYIKYNVVYYKVETTRFPYLAIADNIPIGSLPTDINYWYPLAIKGEQGETGLGLTPRGYWNDSTQYYKDDMIAYNNVLWAALSDNINYLPAEGSTVWLKMLAFSAEYLTYDNSKSGLKSVMMQDAIDEVNVKVDDCFISVSNGKSLVASAITDKGVTTDATATFATMAGNIDNISTGVETYDATAIESDVLSGKTFYKDNLKKTGVMSSIGNATKTISTINDESTGRNDKIVNMFVTDGDGAIQTTFIPPQGYYDGVNSKVNLRLWGVTPAMVKTGQSIGNVTNPWLTGSYTSDGTVNAGDILNGKVAYSKGNKITGSMAVRDSITSAVSMVISSGALYVRLTPGAYLTNASSGYPEISIPQATLASAIGLTADKIVAGQTILGIAGTGYGKWA